jgi:hypothetical protein
MTRHPIQGAGSAVAINVKTLKISPLSETQQSPTKKLTIQALIIEDVKQ